MELSVSPSIKYRKDIDGLRAIAILLVVLYHCNISYFSGGFIGVDVFFVISGFLIGGIIYHDFSNNSFSYAKFYARRIKRIFPALAAMLIFCFIISCFFLTPEEFKDFSVFANAALLSVPNIALWYKTNYFSAGAEYNPLLMTWSLGVEEQFYIFLPILFTCLWHLRRKLLWVVYGITALSLIGSIILTGTSPLFSFYMLPTRAWELGFGVILTIMQREGTLPALGAKIKDIAFVIGTALVLIAAFTFDKSTGIPGYKALLPVAGTVLIIVGNGRISSLLLERKVMIFIGTVSYSWYLWHWPLLSFARLSINEPLLPGYAVLISVVALGIAYLSYRFVETPFRKGMAVSNKFVINSYLSAVFLLMLPTSFTYFSRGIPARVNETVNIADQAKFKEVTNHCLIGYGITDFRKKSSCLPTGDNDAISLVGDSHASALRGGINEFARKNNLAVYELTKSSCPFLASVTRPVLAYPSHADECLKFNKQVMDYILNNSRIKTVVIAGFWDAGLKGENKEYISGDKKITGLAALDSGLTQAITLLQQAGKKVIIMNDTPLLEFDAIRAIATNNIGMRRFIHNMFTDGTTGSELTNNYYPPAEKVNVLLQSYNTLYGVTVFNPMQNICSTDGCYFSKNSMPLFYDNQHLTATGSRIALFGL